MSDEDNLVLFRRVPKQVPRRDLRNFAAALRDRVAGGRPFCCLLTHNAELQRLNREFLAKDYPTDVLSFPSGDGAGSLGEIAISIDRASAQAGAYGHDAATEIKILMLHGLLHLIGMDHERDRGRMARAEKSWRKKLALPDGLIERSSV
jgi:probable rRNA maturation factor